MSEGLGIKQIMKKSCDCDSKTQHQKRLKRTNRNQIATSDVTIAMSNNYNSNGGKGRSGSSGGGGKQLSHTGTNSQGNDYRSYTDGGYAYRNNAPAVPGAGSDGQTSPRSTYYAPQGTGGGAFYKSSTGQGWYENRAGERK